MRGDFFSALEVVLESGHHGVALSVNGRRGDGGSLEQLVEVGWQSCEGKNKENNKKKEIRRRAFQKKQMNSHLRP